jgi:hypothetical protein
MERFTSEQDLAQMVPSERNLFLSAMVQGNQWGLLTAQERLSYFDEDLVRNFRRECLRNSDWWAVSDRQMSEEETFYRQRLRDITSDPNWGDWANLEWPDNPSLMLT